MAGFSIRAVAAATCALALASAASAQIAITGDSTIAPPPPPRQAAASADRATASAPAATSSVESSTALADVAERYKHAVGVVVAVVPNRGPVPIGTAWAIDSRLFATNAHVAADVIKASQKGLPIFVAINGRPDKRLAVSGARVHPEYGKASIRFDGKVAPSGYDFALLRTSSDAPTHVTLASEADLKKLRSGTRVAYLGFPMESLFGGNIDVSMPIATYQDGSITSISDYFMGDSGYVGNRLIRHNLPSAGGASGSPIFTPDGKVVAILWGGNVETGRLTVTAKGEVTEAPRSPSAAMINFAERIDGLSGVPRP